MSRNPSVAEYAAQLITADSRAFVSHSDSANPQAACNDPAVAICFPLAFVGMRPRACGRNAPDSAARWLSAPSPPPPAAPRARGDHRPHDAQPTARQAAQKVAPERLGLRGLTAMPSTSRVPSVFTATAMITATETIRPAWRTFT